MVRALLAALSAVALAGCTGDALVTRAPEPGHGVSAGPQGNPARIELRRLDARPRLTLVTRDGDPTPGIAVVVATDQGPLLTAALAAVMESRLRAAGLDPDVRVDRDAFRLSFLVADPARIPGLFAAVATSAARPVVAGSPEIALAMQRRESLKRNPFDGAELAAAAACTGALGIAPGEVLLDLAADPAPLEAARRAALHAGNLSIAAVGPAAFGAAVAHAMERTEGWLPPAPAAPPPWPASDRAGVYTAPSLSSHGARLTIAVRVADPFTAASAAERLGAPDSPLLARLRLLPEPWRVTQVAGVARSRGGCLGLTLETSAHAVGQPAEPSAALAAAIARREIGAELSARGAPAVSARQILAAADPREAASRAAWWALASPEPSAPAPNPSMRWVTALGIPAPPRTAGPEAATFASDAAADARFAAEVQRASALGQGAERHLGVERGQGELWVLLASPCGVAEESALDPGLGALAVIAALETRRRPDGITLEPWITADGLGVIAHAPFRDDREPPAELARRVADAAARALTATAPPADAVAAARASMLDHLERAAGPQASAEGILAGAMAPDHPSWLEPFGLWSKVAGAGSEAVRLRALALASGPLRVAVIANADAAQAAVASDAVDRWLTPGAGPRTCHAGAPSLPRSGHLDAKLPEGAPLAQGFVALPIPAPGTAGRELAEMIAAALDGPGGLLAPALADATASVRIMGGTRAPALVVDVRAPEGGLAQALADVKALLLRLPTTAAETDLARAYSTWERREQEARTDPRRRLVDLWSGRRDIMVGRPALATFRAALAALLREGAMIVVEGRA